MHLKEARAKGKLAQFFRQRERTHPHTRKYRFRVVVKLMALNTPRAKRGSAFAKASARRGGGKRKGAVNTPAERGGYTGRHPGRAG